MAKRIINKNSILEAKRAQAAISRESFVAIEGVAEAIKTKSNITLPILTIKRNLVKDFIFAVAAVALILMLKNTQYGFSVVSNLLSQ